MAQKTVFGEAELETYMKIERAKGGVEYRKVTSQARVEMVDGKVVSAIAEDGTAVEVVITEEEYEEAIGTNG